MKNVDLIKSAVDKFGNVFMSEQPWFLQDKEFMLRDFLQKNIDNEEIVALALENKIKGNMEEYNIVLEEEREARQAMIDKLRKEYEELE